MTISKNINAAFWLIFVLAIISIV